MSSAINWFCICYKPGIGWKLFRLNDFWANSSVFDLLNTKDTKGIFITLVIFSKNYWESWFLYMLNVCAIISGEASVPNRWWIFKETFHIFVIDIAEFTTIGSWMFSLLIIQNYQYSLFVMYFVLRLHFRSLDIFTPNSFISSNSSVGFPLRGSSRSQSNLKPKWWQF